MSQQLQRPGLITAIGLLNQVGGGICMVGALGASQGAEGAVFLGAGVFALTVGSGLLGLRPWARKAAIGGYVLNLLAGLADANLVVMGISAGILAGLFSTKVKAAFVPQPLPVSPAVTLPPERQQQAA